MKIRKRRIRVYGDSGKKPQRGEKSRRTPRPPSRKNVRVLQTKKGEKDRAGGGLLRGVRNAEAEKKTQRGKKGVVTFVRKKLGRANREKDIGKGMETGVRKGGNKKECCRTKQGLGGIKTKEYLIERGGGGGAKKRKTRGREKIQEVPTRDQKRGPTPRG